MAVVRTINGDVSPDTLGVVNAHDHLIRVGAGEVYIDSDHLLCLLYTSPSPRDRG